MLIRQGIRTLLEMDSGISVVAEAADGAETVDKVLAMPVDVLLLDIRMPRRDGLGVLHVLSERDALPPTLILTTFDDSEVVLDGIRAGARGFLLKDVSYQQLLAAIRAVAGGATVFQPAVTERLLRAGALRPDGPAAAPDRGRGRSFSAVSGHFRHTASILLPSGSNRNAA